MSKIPFNNVPVPTSQRDTHLEKQLLGFVATANYQLQVDV